MIIMPIHPSWRHRDQLPPPLLLLFPQPLMQSWASSAAIPSPKSAAHVSDETSELGNEF
jgi:hypothetical protein